jgi:hypothetical protein
VELALLSRILSKEEMGNYFVFLLDGVCGNLDET